jgi:CRISPR/Cas system-associated exonuclease Cas4 (RecB family)
MSSFYNPRRTKNIYDPKNSEVFKISRSKIDLYLECPRCFYLDRRLGVGRPPGFPFNLNSAVDTLLKKEFDIHRAKKSTHPLMQTYGINAVPFEHPQMDFWRDALRGGIQYLHKPTNLLVTGGVDDIWVTPEGELIVVDYKATSKQGEVNLDAEWQDGYRRQVETYQWLFRQNGFKVSKTAYFVYCNGQTDREAFDAKLEFDIKIIPYVGDTAWLEPTLLSIKKCLDAERAPKKGETCDYCAYREEVAKEEL